MTKQSWHFSGDFNGRGKSTLMYWASEEGGWQVLRPSMTPPDLLEKATSGLGNETTVLYKPLTDGTVYTKDNTAQWPVRDLQAPMHVAATVQVDNTLGTKNDVNYFYTGAKAAMNGRGFLGFRQVQSTDVETQLRTTVTFSQDWPYVGLPALTELKKTSGELLRQTTNTFKCLNPADASVCVTAFGNRYFPYVSPSVEVANDLDGSAFPTVTTESSYDVYGNPMSVIVTRKIGTTKKFTQTTANNYSNDTVKWILGRLLSSSVENDNAPAP